MVNQTTKELEFKSFELDIQKQPNDETCGPTCLHAVYQYYDDLLSLGEVIDQVNTLNTGGTLAVMLGNHALKRGYEVTLYTYNLMMFDPTWFQSHVDLKSKLLEQKSRKHARRFQQASDAYLRFIDAGGQIKFQELNTKLIKDILNKGVPILTGLSATYLYNCSREIGETNEYDDINGTPAGHFVVIHGYDQNRRTAHIADPLEQNPLGEHHYAVNLQRLINSILLGIVTYDANILIIQPKNVS